MSNILLINPKDDKVENVSDPLIDLRHREKQIENEMFNKEMERYFKERGIKTQFRDYKYIANLGLLSIAAYCRQNGHDVKYIQDGTLNREELEKNIKESDIIGISIKTINKKRSELLAEFCKYINPNALLLAGGAEVTLGGGEGPFDIFIKGAGEKIISDIATYGKEILPECKGIRYKQDDKYIEKEGINTIELKSVPIPAYDLVDNIDQTQFYLETSRGCNYCCSFCVEHARIQTKTYDQIKGTLEAIEKLRQYSTMHIIDSDFLTPEGGAQLFYKAVEEVKPTNYFIIQTRAKRLTEENVKQMYSHNIIDVYLGIESFSDAILKKVRKGVTYAEYKNALKMLKQYAPTPVAYRGNFIQGLPGENEITAKEDYERRKEILDEDLLRIMRDYIFMPLKGSDIFDNQEKYGIILPEDYEPSFRNSLPQHKYECWTQEDIYLHQREMIELKLKYLSRLKEKDNEAR